MPFASYVFAEGYTMILLLELCSDYRVIRPQSSKSAYNMRRAVVLYGEHLGRDARTGDLTDLAVSAWVEWLEGRVAAWTRNGYRTRLLSLWRYAARRKLVEGPGEVRRAPAPEPMPDSWTPEEVGALIAATRHLNPRAGAYFFALLSAAYESGLRKGDLQGLPRESISEAGISFRQSKTQQPHVAPLRPETARAILALPGSHPLACPWSSGRYGEYVFRLRMMAGLTSGGLQKLRRTGATWVAAEHGDEAASQWLGHRSPEMRRFYVDRSRARPKPFLPPKAG